MCLDFFKKILLLFLLPILFSCNHHKVNLKYLPKDSLTRKIDSLSLLINESPEKANLYDLRAQYYLKTNQPEQSLRDLSMALSIDSAKASVYLTLSDIYFSLKQYDKCFQAIQKALSLENTNKTALYKMAEFYFYLKKYNEVFTYTEKLLEIDRNYPSANVILGLTYKETGDTIKAINCFQKAVELDMNQYDSYLQLGLIYSAKKNELAIAFIQNALNLRPSSIEAMYALAMFYQESGKYTDAINHYNNILKIEPKNKNASYNIGYIQLVYLKDYVQAKTYFSMAATVDSTYAEAFYNRGYCNELLHSVGEAEQDYRKALALKHNYEKALEGLNRIEK